MSAPESAPMDGKPRYLAGYAVIRIDNGSLDHPSSVREVILDGVALPAPGPSNVNVNRSRALVKEQVSSQAQLDSDEATVKSSATDAQTIQAQPFFESALGGANSAYCHAYASCTAAVAALQKSTIVSTQVYNLWSALNAAPSCKESPKPAARRPRTMMARLTAGDRPGIAEIR